MHIVAGNTALSRVGHPVPVRIKVSAPAVYVVIVAIAVIGRPDGISTPEVSMTHIPFIFSQDLVAVVTIKAKSRGGHTICPLQPVAIRIWVDRLPCGFIRIIGPVLMINVVFAGFMTGETIDLVAGSIETVSCIVTDHIGCIGSHQCRRIAVFKLYRVCIHNLTATGVVGQHHVPECSGSKCVCSQIIPLPTVFLLIHIDGF